MMPTLPTFKNKAIMCCGCNRLMGVDGKPIGLMQFDTSRRPTGLVSHISSEQIAWYETNEACDDGARGFGWKAEDGNHRCPHCFDAEKRAAGSRASAHHGAYIDRAGLNLDSPTLESLPLPVHPVATNQKEKA